MPCRGFFIAGFACGRAPFRHLPMPVVFAGSPAYKRFGAAKTLPQGGFTPPEDMKFCGVPAKSADFVGAFRAPGAGPFLCGQKGAKKPLRTCGSKDSLCPDVYWRSCSSCGVGSSERRRTLRLPPSPRFKRAGLVDGRAAGRFAPHHKTPNQVRGSDYRTWRPS